MSTLCTTQHKRTKIDFFIAYLVTMILVFSFGTIFSIVWYRIGLPHAEYILAAKDALILLGIFFVIVKQFSKFQHWNGTITFNAHDMWIALILGVNLMAFSLSSAAINMRVINFRRNTTLFLLFWVTYRLCCSSNYIVTIRKWCLLALIPICIFGLFEYSSPDSLWNRWIDIPHYWQQVEVDPFGTSTIADSGRFYSWDIALSGNPARRMVSLYAEPTTLGAYFVFLLCMLWTENAPWKILLVTLLGILTVSKFFILSLMLIVAIYHVRNTISRHFIYFVYVLCVVAAIAIMALSIQSGALAHLQGIVSLSKVFINQKYFGYGLGSAGNYSSDTNAPDIGGESGIGNITAQIGIGVVVYLAFFVFLYRELHCKWSKTGRKEYFAGILMLITWIASFFMSASSLGLSGNAFCMMYIGCLLAANDTVDNTSAMKGNFLSRATLS